MAGPVETYGDISPRTAAFAVEEMLMRGIPIKISEKLGTPKVLPKGKTDSLKFRRYESLPAATTALTEGVTPPGSKVTHTDYNVTLEQYGDYVQPTDRIADTHEDPVFREFQSILGEQAAETVEVVRLGKLKAGTSVYYANGASRVAVNTAIAYEDQLKVTRGFQRQNAKRFTDIVASTSDFNTQSIEPSFLSLSHVDMEKDIRALTGFVSIADYGSRSWMEGELGAVTTNRYMLTNLLTPFEDAGGAKGAMISTTGTSADVYPTLFFAKNAFQTVVLAGMNALTVKVKNPGDVSDSDPLGQRGLISWKTYTATIITNQLWMARLESGATELV